MKTKIIGRIRIFGIAVLCISTFWSTAFSAGIRWYSYAEGIAIAKEENKKIFLYFWADWCQFCGKMESETLSKTAVIEFLNDKFIPIRIKLHEIVQIIST